jgi:anti-sigma factor RsiW
MRNHHFSDLELLLALDHELPSRRQKAVDAHLAHCVACRARHARIDHVAENVTALLKDDLYKEDATVPAGRAGRARERLRSKLTEMADEWDGSLRVRLVSRFMLTPRRVMVGAALAATALFFIRVAPPSRPIDASSAAASIEPEALPVASLTPGASWHLSVGEVCAGGAPEQREVPAAVRRNVLRAYGMEQVPHDEYELDYLITPQLGGAPDARNLWPQPYASGTWNARVKDQLERLLPQLVCDRQVTLETAQHDIALDWIAAYRKYFKTEAPLRIQARFFMDDDSDSVEPTGVTHAVWRSASAPTLKPIALSRTH